MLFLLKSDSREGPLVFMVTGRSCRAVLAGLIPALCPPRDSAGPTLAQTRAVSGGHPCPPVVAAAAPATAAGRGETEGAGPTIAPGEAGGAEDMAVTSISSKTDWRELCRKAQWSPA